MLVPPRQRQRLLGRILRAVIDASDAALVAADMVQHRFDNVRLNADVSHAGGNSSADVVMNPMR
jgi:hypothetical protein